MLIRYDSEAKAAYVKLLNSDVTESEEVAPGVVFDFDVEDRVRGIEFYSLDSFSEEELNNLDLPIHPQAKEILSQWLFSSLNEKSSSWTVQVEKTHKGHFVTHPIKQDNKAELPNKIEIAM